MERPGENHVLAAARQVVGLRPTVTREEVAEILLEAFPGTLVEVSVLAAQATDSGRWIVAGKTYADLEGANQAMAIVWGDMCRGKICVAVSDDQVRFDTPGSLGPTFRTKLLFVPETVPEVDLAHVRAHCTRLLAVRGAIRPARARLAELRGLQGVDGRWVRVLDDGTLELRNPRQTAHPRFAARRQFMVDPDTGDLLVRSLLPEAWSDAGDPDDGGAWSGARIPPADARVAAYWWVLASDAPAIPKVVAGQ